VEDGGHVVKSNFVKFETRYGNPQTAVFVRAEHVVMVDYTNDTVISCILELVNGRKLEVKGRRETVVQLLDAALDRDEVRIVADERRLPIAPVWRNVLAGSRWSEPTPLGTGATWHDQLNGLIRASTMTGDAVWVDRVALCTLIEEADQLRRHYNADLIVRGFGQDYYLDQSDYDKALQDRSQAEDQINAFRST
jgi:hypothetical protein